MVKEDTIGEFYFIGIKKILISKYNKKFSFKEKLVKKRLLCIILLFVLLFTICSCTIKPIVDDPVIDDPVIEDPVIEDPIKSPVSFNIITEEGVITTEEFISAVNSALGDIELISGLLYEIESYPSLTIFIISINNESIGGYATLDGDFFIREIYIEIVPSNPFIIHHEGLHSIRFRNKYFSSITFEEGLADYVCNLLSRKLGYREIKGNPSPDAIISSYAGIDDYKQIIERNCSKMEDIFLGEIPSEDPLFVYYMGEIFFHYLEDKYGSVKNEVYCINGDAVTGLKQIYGNDVFTGFEVWWNDNKSRVRAFWGDI